MEEIKVGEYVRTADGLIGKLEQINKEPTDDTVTYIVTDIFCGMIEEIVNHSFNLIDLIEVGDVIQLKGEEKLKYEVLKISWSPSKGKHIHIINPFRTEGGKDIFIEDIKSIVTKEQFQSVEYNIGQNQLKNEALKINVTTGNTGVECHKKS